MARNQSAVHDDMLRRIREAEAKGLLPRPSERKAAPGAAVMLFLLAVIWGAISFATGMALGAPPPFKPGPGYDICTTEVC